MLGPQKKHIKEILDSFLTLEEKSNLCSLRNSRDIAAKKPEFQIGLERFTKWS